MIVITYHKISSPTAFEEQIKYLIKNYNVRKDQTNKPKLLITADDGDPSFYYNAFPILKKYKVPSILFVVTSLINTDKPFWWDEIEYYLGKVEGNKKVWEVKTWANTKRKEYLDELRRTIQKPAFKYKQLTTTQLKMMQESGVTIANHSHTHPMFDKCTASEVKSEMENSVSILEKLGFTSTIFAYPNGNYSLLSENILKESGIEEAYLFDHSINKGRINPLRISRLVVNDTTPLWKFKFILSGWHSKILPFTKTIGKLRK